MDLGDGASAVRLNLQSCLCLYSWKKETTLKLNLVNFMNK